MLNWNPHGRKTILSIDGGGMRGVIALGMLAELEAMTGQPVYDLFDMVAGTSSGAIIAAGIGIHLTAEEILKVYKTVLPPAFGPQGLILWLRWALNGFRHLYPLEPFRQALQPIVEGKKIRDLTDPIVLMTTKDVRTSNTYFIVSKGKGAAAFADWPVSGAVAASSAAPIYFPPVQGNLVDGGVGVYGNPCLAAAIEAMEYIGESEGFIEGQVLHVSLGTGYPPNTLADGAAGSFWLKDWVDYIIGENIDDSGLQQVFTTRAIYPPARMDFRRYNPLLTRDNVENVLGVPLPTGMNPAHLTLDSRSPAELELMEQIGRAYARQPALGPDAESLWEYENAMPWLTKGGHPQPEKSFMQIDWSASPYR